MLRYLMLALALIASPAAALDQASIPSKFPIPWGNSAGSAYIRNIPQASQIGITNCAASLTDGFPPLTFVPASAGGCPPFGQDMNGILRQATQWLRWQGAGAPVPYDSSFSSSIGGYPKGTILAKAATVGCWWLSLIDNNASNPDTGGANWLGYCLSGPSQRNSAYSTAIGGYPKGSVLLNASTQTNFWISTVAANTTDPDAAGVGWSDLYNLAALQFWGGTSGGSANAQTVTIANYLPTPITGIPIRFKAGFSNTTAMTLNVTGTGAIAVRKMTSAGPVALTGGEVVVNQIVTVNYDGSVYELVSSTQPTTFGSITYYASSTTYTPSANMVYAKVTVCGGGGGGGGGPATAANENAVGGGGGGGGGATRLVTKAQVGASQAITVGAPGTNNAGLSGGSGGFSSLGALVVALGGSGGTTSSPGRAPVGPGGNPGTGSVGDVVWSGQPGGTSWGMAQAQFASSVSDMMYGGGGGAGCMGGGSPAKTNTVSDVGSNGVGCGAGGGGAFTAQNIGSSRPGGNAVAGCVIVEEYVQ